MSEPLSSPRRSNIALIVSGAVLAGIFMGGLMASMVLDMHKMTKAVVGMAENVGKMSSDVAIMRGQFVTMTETVKEMNYSLNDLELNMVDMNASVISMDNNMTDLESDIRQIQQSMAKDMHGIQSDVKHLAVNVIGMNAKMGQMGWDIHRGSSSFTSPFNYMQNMMQGSP